MWPLVIGDRHGPLQVMLLISDIVMHAVLVLVKDASGQWGIGLSMPAPVGGNEILNNRSPQITRYPPTPEMARAPNVPKIATQLDRN